MTEENLLLERSHTK